MLYVCLRRRHAGLYVNQFFVKFDVDVASVPRHISLRLNARVLNIGDDSVTLPSRYSVLQCAR